MALIPGVCSVCSCTEHRACAGGCVWANSSATLCSRCVQVPEVPLVALPHELVPMPDDRPRSVATLPDGQRVTLTWDQGDCVSCIDEHGVEVDLFSVFHSREHAELWLSEQVEDDTIPNSVDAAFERLDLEPFGGAS